jgi:carbonic anhydrase
VDTTIFSRRSLLRLGAFASLATVISPAITARAQVVCNPGPTDPGPALSRLLAGNALWASGTQMHPGEDDTRRMCVADNSQTPFAAILSCSDSRVPPELVFDQGLGDLFVARVAGNTASGKLIESLLFGTDNLGAKLLFVMGHSSCGAVRAAVESYPKHSLEFVKLIFPAVKEARKIVKANGGDPNDPNQVIPVATDQNVILVVNRLRKEFRQLIDRGDLLVAGGRYDLSNQQVTVLIQ